MVRALSCSQYLRHAFPSNPFPPQPLHPRVLGYVVSHLASPRGSGEGREARASIHGHPVEQWTQLVELAESWHAQTSLRDLSLPAKGRR